MSPDVLKTIVYNFLTFSNGSITFTNVAAYYVNPKSESRSDFPFAKVKVKNGELNVRDDVTISYRRNGAF